MKLIIQHLKNLFLKVEVHPITIIYFLLAIMGGYIKWYLSALIIVCIHELCHLLMAYYFHFQILKIEILPFGAYLLLDDFYMHSITEDMCVVLAGPSSHILLHMMIQCLTDGVYHDYLISLNTALFLFNLLPIYPLDGGRLIGLILQCFLDFKTALYFHLKLSVLALSCFIIFYIRINTLVMISYLIIQQFYYYQAIPHDLRKFFVFIPMLKNSKKTIIHEDFSYRRGYMNYYILSNGIVSEKEVYLKLIENLK